MLTLYIADAEKDVSMKNLSPKEAIAILSDMKIDIPVPKAAVTQRKRNTALDMAISALNCSEIPNNSDTISRQAVTKFLNDWLSCLFENCHKQSASDLKMIIKDFKNLPSAQPEPEAVFNRDIAIEAICDEVMLWFDISATRAYEIADTAVKRIEVRMEKTEKGKQE